MEFSGRSFALVADLQIFDGFGQIGNMQKAGALQANVHKSGLHPGQHLIDAAFDDVPHRAALARPFNVHILQNAAFHYGDAGLVGGYIDENLFAHGPL